MLHIIEKKLKQYTKELITGSEIFSEKNIIEQIQKIQIEKQAIIEQKVKGALIRSQRNWLEYGEKPNSKYFCQLEKRNYTNKNRY